MQLADISKPLLSITQECDKGQLAVFGAQGGALLDIHTGAIRHLARRGGTYEGEMWIPPVALEKAAAALNHMGTFHGQDW